MSWSADHVVPIKHGGHNTGELRAAHLIHNQQRNRKTQPVARHSRTW
jgi:5-methylcytosine-specific restriction endonuclease McrA